MLNVLCETLWIALWLKCTNWLCLPPLSLPLVTAPGGKHFLHINYQHLPLLTVTRHPEVWIVQLQTINCEETQPEKAFVRLNVFFCCCCWFVVVFLHYGYLPLPQDSKMITLFLLFVSLPTELHCLSVILNEARLTLPLLCLKILHDFEIPTLQHIVS